MPNAILDFVPESGRPSVGQTDERGCFKLDYDPQNSGALLGKHKVSVRMRPTTKEDFDAVIMGQTPTPTPELAELFKKYGTEESKIVVVIERDMKEFKLDWD